MLTNVDKKSVKRVHNFVCEKCNYKCFAKWDFDRHLLTAKHKNVDNMLTNVDNCTQKSVKQLYICDCGKEYKHRQSISVHKKKCQIANKTKLQKCNKKDKDFFMNNDELVNYLMKENSELKNMIVDLCKNNNTITNNNNINNNCNNKTFNLQVFLNETCKNAMNIMDFVNSIQLQLTDLEKVGELGYVEGISNIIINNLKLLDITERPVHCSDMKREVLYVKDDDKWEKEETENPKIKKAIKCIADKNISLIPEWKQKYPDCKNSNSKKSDIINKIIIESMETNKEKTDKIVKKISKEVGIDK
jgi:hypothetical protein